MDPTIYDTPGRYYYARIGVKMGQPQAPAYRRRRRRRRRRQPSRAATAAATATGSRRSAATRQGSVGKAVRRAALLLALSAPLDP